MDDKMKIVFFGAGAVGQSVGGWLAPHHKEVYFLDRGDVADTMKKKGVTLYMKGKENIKSQVDLQVIDDISEVKDADVIVIGVKNFNLESVCKVIKERVGDSPIIIAMQNGIENQKIVPKYF